MKKLFKYVVLTLLFLAVGVGIFVSYVNHLFSDESKKYEKKAQTIVTIDKSTTSIGHSWLREEEPGLWTLYMEGSPFERGLTAGQLTKTLLFKQEKAVVDQVHQIVPNDFYIHFTKYLISAFNLNLYRNMPEENKAEVYGLSLSASSNYKFIAGNYQRLLSYQGLPDMGYASNNYKKEGGTAFALWGKRTANENLLVGRNFDLKMGKNFGKDKIVTFIRPDTGYCHAFVAWGGMIGSISGMNEKGLTVTVNAAKSNGNLKSGTPAAIVARQILQYASTIEEAASIASHFDIFADELYLVASSKENKAVVIEKKHGSQTVFTPKENYVITTNHFQSNENGYTAAGIIQREKTASGYRYQKVKRLIKAQEIFNYKDVAKVLLDTVGFAGKNIGLGNPMAINQFTAQQSVIFSPRQRIFWVSVYPYHSGKYVAYDLNKIFHLRGAIRPETKTTIDSLTFEAGNLTLKHAGKRYARFEELLQQSYARKIGQHGIDSMLHLNNKYYEAHEQAGDFNYNLRNYNLALKEYKKAFSCAIPSEQDKKRLLKKVANCLKKLSGKTWYSSIIK